jgi:undecaprenol kinase/diacylglycerol kinase (ATP)
MKLIKSFGNAINGFLIAFREQRNLKIHLLAVILISVVGFYFEFTYSDWGLIVLAIGLVMGMEVMNSSIEELVNFVSPEKRKEAGRIKDIAAGAVLVTAGAALVLGLIIIFSKLY